MSENIDNERKETVAKLNNQMDNGFDKLQAKVDTVLRITPKAIKALQEITLLPVKSPDALNLQNIALRAYNEILRTLKI